MERYKDTSYFRGTAKAQTGSAHRHTTSIYHNPRHISPVNRHHVFPIEFLSFMKQRRQSTGQLWMQKERKNMYTMAMDPCSFSLIFMAHKHTYRYKLLLFFINIGVTFHWTKPFVSCWMGVSASINLPVFEATVAAIQLFRYYNLRERERERERESLQQYKCYYETQFKLRQAILRS